MPEKAFENYGLFKFSQEWQTTVFQCMQHFFFGYLDYLQELQLTGLVYQGLPLQIRCLDDCHLGPCFQNCGALHISGIKINGTSELSRIGA